MARGGESVILANIYMSTSSINHIPNTNSSELMRPLSWSRAGNGLSVAGPYCDCRPVRLVLSGYAAHTTHHCSNSLLSSLQTGNLHQPISIHSYYLSVQCLPLQGIEVAARTAGYPGCCGLLLLSGPVLPARLAVPPAA